MNEISSFLRETKTFFLATSDNGIPKVRPFGALAEYEGKIYFVTSNTKEVFKQIVANPNVCICACDNNRKWVRIAGIAKFDKNPAAKQKMLNDNPNLLKLKRYSSAADPTMEVFYLDNLRAEFF